MADTVLQSFFDLASQTETPGNMTQAPDETLKGKYGAWCIGFKWIWNQMDPHPFYPRVGWIPPFHPAWARQIPQVETDLLVFWFDNSNFDARNYFQTSWPFMTETPTVKPMFGDRYW